MVRDFVADVYRGKSIGRILFNRTLQAHCHLMKGETLDVAGGERPSYRRLLPPELSLTCTDFRAGSGVDQVVDLNESLPFQDASYDSILFFNGLYIVDDPPLTMKELRRILRPGGVLFLSSPLLYPEIPEPHDFLRLTAEGLQRECLRAGFTSITITRYGERFTAAVQLLQAFCPLKTLRLLLYALAICFDRLIPTSLRCRHPAPIGYFCVARNDSRSS